MTDSDDDAGRLVPAAVVVALMSFIGLQVVAYGLAGVFEYPLDDVYIHLAVAEQIARGGYGINEGELSSPASSILYPLLLVPFAGTEVQRFLPLLLNTAALVISAIYWARIVAAAHIQPVWARVAIALAGPLSLNFVGVAYVGMEHALHVAATLALFWGLIRFVEDGRLAPAIWIGAGIAPLLRFEALAFSLAVAGIVALRGRLRPAVVLGLLAVVPVAGFMAWLASLGLDPLPSSVQMKLTGETGVGPDRGLMETLEGMLRRNFDRRGAYVLLLLSGLVMLTVSIAPAARRRTLMWIALPVLAAALAHFVAGRFGWMNRYEIYIVAAVAGLFVLAVGHNQRALSGVAGVLVIVGAGSGYLRDLTTWYPQAPRAIHLQPAQMARYAQDHLGAEVAVNDIGRVAWGNANDVLDLAGLASAETREILQAGADNGWAGPFVATKGVEHVMIFDRWLGYAVGDDWTLLGTLQLEGNSGALGDDNVTFYATTPEAAARAGPALEAWLAELPPGATFDFAGGGE